MQYLSNGDMLSARKAGFLLLSVVIALPIQDGCTDSHLQLVVFVVVRRMHGDTMVLRLRVWALPILIASVYKYIV